MLESLFKLLPPLGGKRSPALALIIGLLFGGVGLGIYFFSLIDLILPILIAILLSAYFGDIGFIGGVFIAGVYGYMRAYTSNQKLYTSLVTQPPGEKTPEKPKPYMPTSISLGLIFFVISFFVDFLTPTDSKMESIPQEAAIFLGLVVLCLLIFIIISLVLLCKGYSWAVALFLIANLLGYLAMASCGINSFSFGDVFVCASMICFLVSSSWAYYSDCAQYRAYCRAKNR